MKIDRVQSNENPEFSSSIIDTLSDKVEVKVESTTFLERLKETLFVAWFISVPLGSILLTLILLFFPILYLIIIPYYCYVLLDKTYKDGSRRSVWYRRLPVFDILRKYFRSELITLSEFDPTRRYLIAYHPHGILSFGAWSTLGIDSPVTRHQTKNISLCLMTLSQNFVIPFLRDIILGFGFIDSNKETVYKILTGDKNLSCGIVVGGAAEALLASPGRADLVLAKRYGFIKLALQTGVDLIPSYGFGENDIYTQYFPEFNSVLANFQRRLKNVFGFSFPFIVGQGFLENSVGFLPRRGPITVVVGKPILVDRVDNPTDLQIQNLHSIYTTKLRELYDEYKGYHSERVLKLTGEVYNPPELKLV